MMDFATGYTTAFMAAFGGSVQPPRPPPSAPPCRAACRGRDLRQVTGAGAAVKTLKRLGTAGWGVASGPHGPVHRLRAPFQPQQAPRPPPGGRAR